MHCCFHPAICFAVSDADGDTVRCRWAESAQGECGEVCKHFKISLDEVGYIYSITSLTIDPHVAI